LPLRLFDRQESESIFGAGPGSGWDRFYKKFPGCPGIVTVSRVGLNGAKDRAMFYVGRVAGSLNGDGRIYVMKKQDDHWVEIKIRFGPWWVS
jgi:hypothetical protein